MKRLLTAVALLLISGTGSAVGAGTAGEYAEGQKLFGAHQYRAAADKFELAMRAAPRDGNAIYYCALAHQMSNNRSRARQLYEYVQRAFPGSRLATMASSALQQLGGPAPQSGVTGGSGSSSSTTSYSGGGGGRPDTAGTRGEATVVNKNLSCPDTFSVPFERGRNGAGVYVEVSINGHPMKFHLDTGAGGSVIGANQMAEIGFERGAAGDKFQIGGVGDRKDIKGWKQTVQLALGPARVRDFSMDIQDNLEGDPLLGQDFLRNFDTDINPSSGQVTFRKKGTGREEIATRGMVDIPFEDQGTHMIVTAKVNGKPYKFYFDTGADGIAFTMKDLKALGLEIPGDARESMSRGVGGATRTWSFPVNSIALGSLKKEGLEVGVVESSSMDHPLLGQSFFGSWRHKVDTAKHVIHFWPND